MMIWKKFGITKITGIGMKKLIALLIFFSLSLMGMKKCFEDIYKEKILNAIAQQQEADIYQILDQIYLFNKHLKANIDISRVIDAKVVGQAEEIYTKTACPNKEKRKILEQLKNPLEFYKAYILKYENK